MTTVIVSSYDVSSFPDGGGHFWVYLQYVQALRRAGCDVWWMEQCNPPVRHPTPAGWENPRAVVSASATRIALPRP